MEHAAEAFSICCGGQIQESVPTIDLCLWIDGQVDEVTLVEHVHVVKKPHEQSSTEAVGDVPHHDTGTIALANRNPSGPNLS